MTRSSPVILPGSRVAALLDGRMTQLRVPIRIPAPLSAADDITEEVATGLITPDHHLGQRLWVKEAWRTWDRHDGLIPSRIPHDAAIFYDTERWPYAMRTPGRQRRALDMCKRMSRLTLKVTAVQVQRLQDITRGEAMDEGCPFPNLAYGSSPRDWFRDLWDRIHAARGQGWDTNPWVAALTFQTIHANIGEIREHAA